jgi:hypothetical protein
LFYVNCYKNWFFRLVMIRHCRLFLWLLNDCEIVAEWSVFVNLLSMFEFLIVYVDLIDSVSVNDELKWVLFDLYHRSV